MGTAGAPIRRERESSRSSGGSAASIAIRHGAEFVARALMWTAQVLSPSARNVASYPEVVDDIITFFKTGDLPNGRVRSERLKYVGNGVLGFGKSFLVLENVERASNLVAPHVQEARLTFRVIEDPKRAYEFRKLAGGREVPYALGEASFVFTTALSFERNLRDFVRFLDSPAIPASPVTEHSVRL